ncbi:hypothetical protein [Photobacterium sanctipauli]|uniref:hypothetical protein n=1 Tax=Photobacterium sanctipauli TaxID=1342794 RepID=UPI000A72BA8F|nr:hypothetical protein [Photobacterium sanctipauli]
MVKKTLSVLCTSALLCSSFIVSPVLAEEKTVDDPMTDKIGRAKSAAPASISDDATVIVDGKVVVEGTNGWTCLPDTFPGDGMPMCNDKVWMEMLGAMVNKEDFKATQIGISYMLQGDLGAGVSNSDPYHPEPKKADDYVETGPHLMIIVPAEMLEGITDDPSSGGPMSCGKTPRMYTLWCLLPTNRS